MGKSRSLSSITKIEWKPNPKQEYFLSLPDTIKEALYGGAAGGGKSEVLLLLPLIRGFHEHSRFKGIIFRRTYPELQREIIERSFNWYPHAGGVWNSDKKQWQFPSRAIMRFGHMEYEKDARTYDSDEYNYIAFDELTSFTEFQYRYLFSRNRSSDRKLPAIVRSGTNPGNTGHGWVLDRFIEPNGIPVPWGTLLYDKLTKSNRIFIQALIKDNEEHLDPSYYDTLANLPEAECRAKRDGDWHTFAGQVFAEFRSEHIPGESENALHVIKSFEIPSWWPRFVVVDWGYNANTVIIWCAVSPEGKLIIYKEFSVKKTKISIWANELRLISEREGLTNVNKNLILCASAWQNRGDELTIAEQVREHSGFVPRPANNSRIAGKLTVHEYLRWEEKTGRLIRASSEYDSSYAERLLRIEGWESYRKYVDQFQAPEPEINLPKLQIVDTCEGCKKVIPLCTYANKSNTSNKDSEDVAEFPGDDFYDVIRYACMEAEQIKLDPGIVAYQQKLNDIVISLEKTNDQTAFHRNIEKLEREQKPVVRPVRRMHRGRVAA